MHVLARFKVSSRALMLGLAALLCALSLQTGSRSATAAVFDTEDGGYAYSHVDLRVQDDTAFGFVRTYDSLDPRPGPLGPGWTRNFNVRLIAESQGGQDVVTILRPYADDRQFTPLPGGRFKSITPGAGTLIKYQEGPFAGGYELVSPSGTRYQLDPEGRATQITYTNKTTVALTYDEAGEVQTVFTRDGSRRLTFGYDGESRRLVSVKDWLEPPARSVSATTSTGASPRTLTASGPLPGTPTMASCIC